MPTTLSAEEFAARYGNTDSQPAAPVTLSAEEFAKRYAPSVADTARARLAAAGTNTDQVKAAAAAGQNPDPLAPSLADRFKADVSGAVAGTGSLVGGTLAALPESALNVATSVPRSLAAASDTLKGGGSGLDAINAAQNVQPMRGASNLVGAAANDAQTKIRGALGVDPRTLVPQEDLMREAPGTIAALDGLRGRGSATSMATEGVTGDLGTAAGKIAAFADKQRVKIGDVAPAGIMNHLVRAAPKYFKFGANPGEAMVGLTGGFKDIAEQLGPKIEATSARLDTVLNTPAANTKIIDVHTPISQAFDDAITRANRSGNDALANRLETARDARLDTAGPQYQKPAAAYRTMQQIGEDTKWTPDPTEGTVNESMMGAYQKINKSIDLALQAAVPLTRRLANAITAQKTLQNALERGMSADPLTGLKPTNLLTAAPVRTRIAARMNRTFGTPEAPLPETQPYTSQGPLVSQRPNFTMPNAGFDSGAGGINLGPIRNQPTAQRLLPPASSIQMPPSGLTGRPMLPAATLTPNDILMQTLDQYRNQ